MLKYQGKYQVAHQWCIGEKGEYEFSDNDFDNYIVLKNDGCVYRFDKKLLVLNLKYATPINSNMTLTKEPLTTLYKTIEKTIDTVNTFFFDDCIEIQFTEGDMDKVMEVLGTKFGCYKGRAKRSPKNKKNLPNYEAIRSTLEEIKHPELQSKLNNMVLDTSERIGKSKMITWKRLYGKFKEVHKIDIGANAELNGYKPINEIDNKMYYKKLFAILKDM